MTSLILGEAAPWFVARTPTTQRFSFSSAAGRYVLLILAPGPGPDFDQAMSLLASRLQLFDDHNRAAFVVLEDPGLIARAKDRIPGPRFFLDPAGEIGDLFGARGADGERRPMWFLMDPTLRILTMGPVSALAAAFEKLERLGPPESHAGVELHAPVLVVPRVFEPEVCRRLIEHYDTVGGKVSGVMRDIDGKTVGVVDGFKKRRDADVDDEALRQALGLRIRRRLLPQIRNAFQFEATRMERYIVACYDAEEGGYFRPHRDNTTLGTAHRRFACSINLNAEDYQGGDLRFPEFGPRTYRAPTGGAVVFSCSLMHEATPVTAGRRYAFLPFFYDEAAAEIRQANARHLALATAVDRDTTHATAAV
jgi:predicted 2-oxoglutarate/Fe(II)-dependent dioxygenase YbiX